jgi:hypothetical protein
VQIARLDIQVLFHAFDQNAIEILPVAFGQPNLLHDRINSGTYLGTAKKLILSLQQIGNTANQISS